MAADTGEALGKYVVLVEKREFVIEHPRLLPRQGNLGVCSAVCSEVNSAVSTCSGDACFCPILTLAGTPCSQCYASINVTAAALLGSAFSICSSEFAVTASTTNLSITSNSASASSTFVGLAAACTKQCSLVNQALSLCVDDACFCPTALSAGPACSSCLLTVDFIQATDLGSALTICQTEGFGSGNAATNTNSFSLPFPLGSTITVTASAGDVTSSTTSSATSKGGLSGGAIGGIVGGVVGAVAIGAVAVFVLLRRGNTRDPRVDSGQYFPPDQPPPAPPSQRHGDYTEKAETDPRVVPAEPVNEEVPSGAIKYLDPDETAAHGVFPSARENESSGPVGARLASDY